MDPSAREGVPTHRKTTFDLATAAGMSVENVRRFVRRAFRNAALRPGS